MAVAVPGESPASVLNLIERLVNSDTLGATASPRQRSRLARVTGRARKRVRRGAGGRTGQRVA